MSTRRLILTFVAILGMATAPQGSESVTFVVSPHSAIRNLSSAELRRIFLGQTSRWNNRHRIVVCLRPTSSEEGRIVLDRLVRMSGIDYSQHWLGAIFRGDASSPPHVFESRESLIRAVSENDEAIGFVLTSDQAVSPARAITIDGRSPLDPLYAIAR